MLSMLTLFQTNMDQTEGIALSNDCIQQGKFSGAFDIHADGFLDPVIQMESRKMEPGKMEREQTLSKPSPFINLEDVGSCQMHKRGIHGLVLIGAAISYQRQGQSLTIAMAVDAIGHYYFQAADR